MQILKCPQSNYKLWDVCTSQKKSLLPCLWQSALVIGYINSLCPMQIHCSAPVPALNAFPIWKHRNATGKMGQDTEIELPRLSCSVGCSPFLLELCLTGSQDSQGEHWWLQPWDSWISQSKTPLETSALEMGEKGLVWVLALFLTPDLSYWMFQPSQTAANLFLPACYLAASPAKE